MKRMLGKPVAGLCLLAMVMAVPLAAQIGGRPARPKVQRPDGAAWEVLRKNCISCHGIDDYAFYAQDRAAWQKLVASKHKPGEAVLQEKDMDVLLDWLVSKFGPDSKPFPRTYIPPVITTFFSDPEAKTTHEPRVHHLPWDGARRNRKVCGGSLARQAGGYARAGREALRRGTGTLSRVAGPGLGNQSG